MNLELIADIEYLLESNCQDLDLSNRGLADVDIVILVELLKIYDIKIRYLNLYCNNITDNGANMLANLENVRAINIAYNRIHDSGAKSLIENPNIKELDLSDNNIKIKYRNTHHHYLNLGRISHHSNP